MKKWLCLVLLCVVAVPAAAEDANNPQVVLETSKGTIVLELDPENAPKTVKNFLGYVESGFYEGTTFHRVIPGFMVQGGGLTPDMQRKPTRDPIENESKNGLKNDRGTISMARTGDPHSATSQFFINVADNDSLNVGNAGPWGYAVFGRVTEGMDVADAIVSVPRGARDAPKETILIKKAYVKKGE